MRMQLARPDQHLLSPEAVQPAVHDARHHDDLLVRGADALGVQQLPGAAPDRLARHGVSAAQRASATGCSSLSGAASLRQRALRASAGRRLVRLHAARVRAASDAGLNIDFYALGDARSSRSRPRLARSTSS